MYKKIKIHRLHFQFYYKEIGSYKYRPKMHVFFLQTSFFCFYTIIRTQWKNYPSFKNDSKVSLFHSCNIFVK